MNCTANATFHIGPIGRCQNRYRLYADIFTKDGKTIHLETSVLIGPALWNDLLKNSIGALQRIKRKTPGTQHISRIYWNWDENICDLAEYHKLAYKHTKTRLENGK